MMSKPPVDAPHFKVNPTPTAKITPPKTELRRISLDTCVIGINSKNNDDKTTLKKL